MNIYKHLAQSASHAASGQPVVLTLVFCPNEHCTWTGQTVLWFKCTSVKAYLHLTSWAEQQASSLTDGVS